MYLVPFNQVSTFHSKNLFNEAFEIAHDIADYDLFMDLYNLTKCIGSLSEFAQAAFSQAAAIIHGEHHADGNLSLTLASELRPDSACSQSSYSTPSQQALKNYVPPLPSFKSKIFNAEMIKINIPKPELRPPLPELRTTKLSSATTTTSLVALAQKSGSQAPVKHTNSNGRHQKVLLNITAYHNLVPFAGNGWSQDVPDQTVGLPLPSSPVARLQPAAFVEQGPQMAPALSHQPKFYQHPLVSGNIPAMLPALGNEDYQKRLLLKKPTASILSNAAAAPINGETPATPSVKAAPAEKNKVKFSDTIQVAVVPVSLAISTFDCAHLTTICLLCQEIPRKEKPMPPKRNGYSRPAARHLTNPRKELADSLPLCHPNDEYLKDFNPITTSE